MRLLVVSPSADGIRRRPWLQRLGARWRLAEHRGPTGSWVERRARNLRDVVANSAANPKRALALRRQGRRGTDGRGPEVYGWFARCLPIVSGGADLVYFTSLSAARSFYPVLGMLPTIVSAPIDTPRRRFEWDLAVYRRVSIVHCASESDRSELIDAGIAADGVVAALADLEAEPLWSEPIRRSRTIIWTQYLDWRSRIDEALAALRRVIDSGVDMDLVVAADGPGRRRAALVRRELALEEHVRFHDGLDLGDMDLPSAPLGIVHLDIFGGLDRGLITALASGVPAIVHGDGDATGLVRDGVEGFEVELGDVDGVYRSMMRLAEEDDQTRGMRERCRARFCELLDPDRQAESFAQAVERQMGDAQRAVAPSGRRSS